MDNIMIMILEYERNANLILGFLIKTILPQLEKTLDIENNY